MEKSPPNLIRTRFLRALFPPARFVVITRHPIAVAYSTRKWRPDCSIEELIQHWIHCHGLFYEDVQDLAELVHVVSYEAFVATPNGVLGDVFRFLRIPLVETVVEVRSGASDKYFALWERDPESVRQRIIDRLEQGVIPFGYTLRATAP